MLDSVIDLSHHNGNNIDFEKVRQSGVLAVIHKATQGLAMRDPAYFLNKHRALSAGLLWGAYHFGTNERGAAQADFFVNTVKPDKNTFLVLDYEPNYSEQATMRLNDAREFVETVSSLTGRYPGFYSGHLIKNQLAGKPQDTILSNCPLWVAQYGPKVTNLPTATWTNWTLWQYTETGLIEGVGHSDRNKFNGDEAGLRKLWIQN